MKNLHIERVAFWFALVLCIVLSVGLFVGCVDNGTVDGAETSAGDSTLDVTDAPTENPMDESTEADSSDATDIPTEELKGWEPDTGKFNDGIVVYDKFVETEVFDAYPDELVGHLMIPGGNGVINTFHADFEDNDPTCGGNASVRAAGATDCREGVLYSPFDANSPTLTGGAWTTWGPNPSSSVKEYKQAQLSVDWTVVSAGNGAWLNAMWGCYVSNYTYKIPDGPGDGL